ncbi:MAG: hypothetical protein ACM3SY_14005, partial [Candidatus Omnitrophota bacterium]
TFDRNPPTRRRDKIIIQESQQKIQRKYVNLMKKFKRRIAGVKVIKVEIEISRWYNTIIHDE